MKDNAKLFIWGGFALITCVMLAWPVAKFMKKGTPQELSLPQETTTAFHTEQAAPDANPPEDNGLRPIDTPLTRDLSQSQPQPQEQARPVMPVAGAYYGRSSQEETPQAAPRAAERTEEEPRYEGSKREQAFLRKHGKEIRAYQDHLGALGRKYRAKYPALRKMDADFAKMDRYMALQQQYAKDHNAFNWARGVLALPEVRSAIIRYSTNPEVVQAMVEVASEAMRQPPSQEIQKEIQHFLTSDEKTSQEVNTILNQSLTNAMGTLMAMPAKTMAPLQKLGVKLSGNTDFSKAFNANQ